MAVQEGPTFKRYAANGVTTVFAIPFLLLDADDLVVTLDGALVASGFTLSGVGGIDSSATFAVAPAGDLLFRLVVPFQRLFDYQENGDFLAETVNADFDRIWLALKELRRYDERSLRVSDLEPEGVEDLPSIADRSLKLLSFDADGQPIAVAAAEGSATDIEIRMADNVDSLNGSGMLGHRGRTQRQKNDDVISVADYGGIGTGDETTAFNAACTAAGQGGQVYIPFKTFTVGVTNNANRCRIIGANTVMTGTIRNHTGLRNIIANGFTQDNLRNYLPEPCESNPLLVYRQTSASYYVMARKQGRRGGGIISEVVRDVVTVSNSLGGAAELLRATRVHNCKGFYAWRGTANTESGTWENFTIPAANLGHTYPAVSYRNELDA